jgi:[ribosomal protein S5]-alanine N-acetyltransferase
MDTGSEIKIFVETERLILRELILSDAEGMFELDSDPEVQRFLGNNPVTDIAQSHDVIEFVRQQYKENGIGRWAMVEKSSGDFMGWTGLKLFTQEVNGHINYYDVGYRLIPRYWGKGYATESAIASVDYGFRELKAKEIIGTVDPQNFASKKVLEKAGLRYVETFESPWGTMEWYRIENPGTASR